MTCLHRTEEEEGSPTRGLSSIPIVHITVADCTQSHNPDQTQPYCHLKPESAPNHCEPIRDPDAPAPLPASPTSLNFRSPSAPDLAISLFRAKPSPARSLSKGRRACCPRGLAMGGSAVRDGTLSLDDFYSSAKALIEKWKETDVDDSLPDWAWKPCCKMGVPSETEGFLALERVYHISEGNQTEESNNIDHKGLVQHGTSVQSSSENVHVYDFHIVYSFSYKVPVLYFQGHHAGGQVLTLDEIKEDLPSNSLKVLSESKWTFITREEHPHLSRPWFTLHPCGTGDWMKLLLEDTKLADKDQQLHYLPAWLSVVGQAVGLKIPLKLYCDK